MWGTVRWAYYRSSHPFPMTPEVYRVFTDVWQERRLVTERVFLYKGLPTRDGKTAFDKACKLLEPRTCGCMISRHTASTKEGRDGCHNSLKTSDVLFPGVRLIQTETVIILDAVASGAETASACLSSSRP